MDKKKRMTAVLILIIAEVVISIGVFVTNGMVAKHETIKEVMRDAVLHEDNRISLFGIKDVNPSLIAGFTVTALLLVFAAILRIFVIPKFTYVPGKMQILIEEWVGFFKKLAETNSHIRNKFLGAYIFAAGTYIFFGTIFELFGLEAITTKGHPIALPAPLADINGAVCMGCLSYLVILSGGIAVNKLRGVALTLKEFSLPISMSFRLFGALLSGMLVTELIYFYLGLSIILPVVVGVLFTLIHALVQAYVLTMLVSMFYGEVTEPKKPKEKKKKQPKNGTPDDGEPAAESDEENNKDENSKEAA